MGRALKEGIYRHYKGGLYEVIAVGTESDSHADVVIYKSVETGRFFTRELSIFLETVEHEGKTVARFSLLDGKADQS